MYIHQSQAPNSSHLYTSVLYICISVPARQIGSSVPFFPRFYIHVLIYDICSLSDLVHSVLKALTSSTSLELSQMCSFLWLWVISFNWYKKGTILLPWRIVNILVFVDCVFTRNVNLSLMFMMSCGWSRGLRTFWFSVSSGLCSGRCSVLPVTAHWAGWDIWLSPSGKGRIAIRWCQPPPSELHLTESSH